MERLLLLLRSLKPCKSEHWLMLSILLYSLVGVLKYYLPVFITNVITSVCGFGFIVLIIMNIRRCSLTGWIRALYLFLVFWTLCLTLRMFLIDDVRGTFGEYNGITTWLLAYFSSPYFLPNLMPLILLTIPAQNGFDFRYLWRAMFLMMILYLCYYPFAFWSMTHYNWSFNVAGAGWGEAGTYGDFISNSTKGIAAIAPAVIMIYLKKYLPVGTWRWFMIAFVGSMLIQTFLARRGNLAISILYLVLAWGMYSFNDRHVSKVKMILIALAVVGVCLLLFSNMADSFFSTLMERGIADSRSGVESGFYKDMDSAADWIFGRGWFGQYYEPIFDKLRSSIETGYLALILRGGLLYLIPYAGILGLSFYNGYFKSRNLFCKSFAIICLMQIISLYPYGWPTFNFLHFVIWLGVWVCNSKALRLMNDRQIKRLIF